MRVTEKSRLHTLTYFRDFRLISRIRTKHQTPSDSSWKIRESGIPRKFPTFPENPARRIGNQRRKERDGERVGGWVGGWVTCIVIADELNCKWPPGRIGRRRIAAASDALPRDRTDGRMDRHKSPCIPKRYTPWQLLSKQSEAHTTTPCSSPTLAPTV